MTVRIPLEFGSTGTNKTVQEILAIRDAIKRTANERNGFIQLSEAFGTTYKAAKDLSQELGLGADKIAKAVNVLQQLEAIGVDAATQLKTLEREFGLTAEQAERLSKIVGVQRAGFKQLAENLGITYQQAKQLSQELGIDSVRLTQAAQAVKQLGSEGVDTATQIQVLQERLGFTAKQARQFSGSIGQYQKSASESTEKTFALGGGVAELAFKFNNVVQSVQAVAAAAKPVYDFLIGSNEKLNAQLLSSQTNLASSTRIFQGGIEVTDPTAKINASRTALQAALKQIEKDTQSLVGVTSEQVNELFQITLTNASELNNQSKQFPGPIEAATSLTKGWAASLKVIGIPLDQARQEINSIIKAEISQDSQLGKNLNLTNEQVKQYKAQGRLVDELNKRLETFVAGNAIAARSVDGISSNILDLVQRFGRLAGEPLLEPIISALAELEKFLKENEAAVTAFFTDLVNQAVKTGTELGNVLVPLLEAIGDLGRAMFDLANSDFRALVSAADGSIPVFTALLLPLTGLVRLIAEITKGTAALAKTGFGRVVLEAGLAATALASPLGLLSKLGQAFSGQADKAAQKTKQLAKDSGKDLKFQAKEIESLGGSYEQLNKKVADAQTNLANQGGGDSAKFQQAAKDLEDLTQKQLEAGQITRQEAIQRLEDIQNNSKVDVDTQLKAKQEIVKIKKDQVDAEIALIQAGQAEIEAAQAAGRIGEAEADKELTDSKAEEIQKRIEANKAALETATGPEREKLLAEERKLQSELEKVREEFRKRENKRRLEDFDEQRKVLEGQFARGATDRASYNQQLTQIDQKQSAEELRQLGEDLQRLESTDKEGREAINAKIGEAYKKRSELAKQAYDREVKLLDDALAKANDIIKLAETEFQTDVQALQNIGAISTEEADKRRLDSTLNRISKEFDAEKEKYDALAALPELDDPIAQEEQQKVLRAQQQKLADLRLQNLQVIEQREQKLRDIAIKNIQQQTALTVANLDKQKIAQDKITRSLERQQKLIQSSANLQKALSDSQLSASDGELQGVEKALELRRQLNSEQNPEKRRAIEEAISRLGINSSATELDLIQQKQQIENRIAEQKRKSLEADQARARAALELDLKREESATRRAVTEARSGAAQAQAALAQAQQIKDPKEREIAVAQAQNQVAEAQQGLKEAKQAVEDQKSISAESRQTLAIQQQTELSTFNTAENFRLIDQTLESAAARAEAFNQSLQKAASASSSIGGLGAPTPRRSGGPVEAGQPYLVGEEGPELILPNRNGFVMTANQTAAMLGGVAVPALQAGQAVMSSRIGGIGGVQDTALLEEVQDLNQSLKEVAEQAAYPRTLVVSNEAPLASAAQIWSDISKHRVRRSGK